MVSAALQDGGPAFGAGVLVLQPLAQAVNVVQVLAGALQGLAAQPELLLADEALLDSPVYSHLKPAYVFLIDFPYSLRRQVFSVLGQGQLDCMGGNARELAHPGS